MSKLNKIFHKTLKSEETIFSNRSAPDSLEVYHSNVVDLLEVDFCTSMNLFIDKMFDAEVCFVEAAGRLNGEEWTKDTLCI